MNERQKRFVHEYLKDFNGTQAYLRAGYKTSVKVAGIQAAKALNRPEIKAAIGAASAEVAEKTKVDAAWLLTRLAEEADADVADLFDEDGGLKQTSEWPKIWRKGLVAGIDVEYADQGKRITKIRLSDRAKRLELIGRHTEVQAWRDNVNVGVTEVIRKDWRGKNAKD